ncbi:MAG: EAL domain-containing protein [Leptothrix sp. (in: b-proteobacteria)]
MPALSSWFDRLPFRIKLAMLASASTLLALGFMATLTASLVWWAADESARYQSMALKPLLSAALTGPMIEHDYAAVQDIARTIVARDGILELTVRTSDGREIVRQQAAGVVAPRLLVRNDTVLLEESGLNFGSVSLRFVPGPMVALLKGLLWAVLASVLVSIVLALWVFRGWARHLSRGLEHLSLSAAALAAGDLTVRANVPTSDEIGDLASAFNHMAHDLEEQFEALGQAENEQRRHAETEREQHSRLEALFGALTEGIVFTNTNDRILHSNPAFIQLWQLDANTPLEQTDLGELFARSKLQPSLTAPDFPLERHGRGVARELMRTDGREITETCLPVAPEGRVIGHLWIYEDITESRRALREIAWLAERDSLTGLYNRRAFERELDRRLQERSRHGGQLALMYLDLDEFKELNDGLGHAAGDAMLTRMAGELSAAVRQDEFLARLGGDEFGLISWVEGPAAALGMAERVIDTIRRITLVFGPHTLHLTGSAGVALAPEHGSSAGELSTAADTAMYSAKASGRNAARLYQPEAQDAGLSRLNWNQRLFRAFEKNLFELHFQGIWYPDGRLSHAEVLLRLRDEENPAQLIMPGQFIAHAERSGIIRDIDRWVFQEAVRVMAEQPLQLAVNVSGRTVEAGGFVEFARRTLAHYGVDPKRLIIELTETAAVGDLIDARTFIAELRQLGCKLALDDFGSGYSSFAYLKHLRTDLVKIDGQFVLRIDQEIENQIFVRAIAEATRRVSGGTVAEFVEDEASALILPKLGVTLMQGYRFDRPAPLAQFLQTALLAGGCVGST